MSQRAMNTVFVLLLLTTGVLAAVFRTSEEKDQGKLPLASPVTNAPGEVEITAGTSRSKVHVGKSVRFWLTIRNRTADAISNVTIAPAGLSEFKIVSGCWRAGSSESCVPPAQAGTHVPGQAVGKLPDEEVLLAELDAGQTVSIWGDLQSERRQEKQRSYLTMRWQTLGQKQSQLIVPMGELDAQDWLDTFTEVWAAFLGFFKDLALPILLAVLAYVFKKWEDVREAERRNIEAEREDQRRKIEADREVAHQKAEWDRQTDRLQKEKDREAAREQAEKEKETARHDAEKLLDQQRQQLERERQQLLQTWNNMLPISHEDATKYYMPLGSAVRSTLESFERCLTGLDKVPPDLPFGSPHTKHALYYFLVTMRRCRCIADERGGFYFKDRLGEKLTALCVEKLGALYIHDSDDAAEKTSELLGGISPQEKLGAFVPKLNESLSKVTSNPPVKDTQFIVYQHFFAWLFTPEFRESIPLLKALTAILDFEMNKPYEYWYPKDQKERLTSDSKIEKFLREFAEAKKKEDAEYCNLPDELEAYLQRSR
jgi:F0F1-type ATP synthase membrane subunit b/b'